MIRSLGVSIVLLTLILFSTALMQNAKADINWEQDGFCNATGTGTQTINCNMNTSSTNVPSPTNYVHYQLPFCSGNILLTANVIITNCPPTITSYNINANIFVNGTYVPASTSQNTACNGLTQTYNLNAIIPNTFNNTDVFTNATFTVLAGSGSHTITIQPTASCVINTTQILQNNAFNNDMNSIKSTLPNGFSNTHSVVVGSGCTGSPSNSPCYQSPTQQAGTTNTFCIRYGDIGIFNPTVYDLVWAEAQRDGFATLNNNNITIYNSATQAPLASTTNVSSTSLFDNGVYHWFEKNTTIDMSSFGGNVVDLEICSNTTEITSSLIPTEYDDIYFAGRTVVSPATTTTTTSTTTTTTMGATTTTLSGQTPPAPAGTHARITSISVNDQNPAPDETVLVTMQVTNDGNTTWNFPIGLSIGNVSTSIFCDVACYEDAFGAYVFTGQLPIGSTTQVTRLFKFRNSFFQIGNSYDLVATANGQTYPSPDQVFNRTTILNYFHVIPLSQKIFAYAISARPDQTQTTQRGTVTITAYVLNNQSIPYNFTVGMSIGIWDAVNGQVYTSTQTPFLPPCNTECYTDGKGDFVNIIIPPNFTAPIQRSFVIPDYFINDTPFDVAVGVWNTPNPTSPNNLISVVYFKNISFVSSAPPPNAIIGQGLNALWGLTFNTFQIGFGVNQSIAQLIAWTFITIVADVIIIALVGGVAPKNTQLQIVPLSSAIFLLSFIVGTASGFVPLIFGVIIIMLLGVLTFKMFTS